MRALTLHQPFAILAARGIKTVENRGWQTPYRGRLLIHAGLSTESLDADLPEGVIAPPAASLAFGALVGVVRLTACVRYGPTLDADPWACGPWCWLLADARPFKKPIPFRGERGLFNIAVTEGLRSALAAAGMKA